MNTKILIFDCESIGTESNAVVLDCALLVYDIVEDKKTQVRDLLKRVKVVKLNVKEQLRHGRIVEADALDFWAKQGKTAPQLIAESSEEPLVNSIEEIRTYLAEQGYNKDICQAWQRGTTDIMWLDSLCKDLNVDKLIHWWKVRDIRTAVDLSGTSSNLNGYPDNSWAEAQRQIDGFQKHDAAHDVLMEVIILRTAGVLPEDGW